MNQPPEASPSHPSSAATERPRRGVRAAGKARSRSKLLEAAKRLFMERGYEGATVRDIASAAGLSTGAVFASFSDKADLFNAVLLADCPTQIEAMDEVLARTKGRVQDRLTAVLEVGYRFQFEQLELMRAALAVSWSQGLAGEVGDRPIRQAAVGVIRRLLDEGVERGEISARADLDLIVDMIWEVYVASYRLALFGNWQADQLKARTARQIEVILAGQSGAN